jgi:hypothetical protein
MLTVDVVPGVRLSGDPGVVDLPVGARRIVALFDGWGSWGTGMEAAARCRAETEARWRNTPPTSLEAAVADVHDIANSTPAEFRADDYDCAFHGVVLLLEGSSIHVAAAGAFPVVLASRSGFMLLFKPRTLGDHVSEERTLLAEELAALPHKDVCLGPYLASDRDLSPLTCSGPHVVPVGGVVLVANPDIIATLESKPPRSWIDCPASELRALDPRSSVPPVVVIRNKPTRR